MKDLGRDLGGVLSRYLQSFRRWMMEDDDSMMDDDGEGIGSFHGALYAYFVYRAPGYSIQRAREQRKAKKG